MVFGTVKEGSLDSQLRTSHQKVEEKIRIFVNFQSKLILQHLELTNVGSSCYENKVVKKRLDDIETSSFTSK